MNVRLLRKVAKHISEKPTRLCMAIFSSGAPNCQTIGCIAGWASMLTGTPENHANEKTGKAALKLTEKQTQRLFWMSGWPTEFQKRYWKPKTQKGRAAVAVARIEHFIKTKGAE